MYSNLSNGYPTFTHFPAEDQEMWFRQFAVSILIFLLIFLIFNIKFLQIVFFFQQEFTWNPDHTNFIRDAFVHKVIDNYEKQIYEWKQKWLINQVFLNLLNNFLNLLNYFWIY